MPIRFDFNQQIGLLQGLNHGRSGLKAIKPGGTVAVNAIHLDTVPEFPYELLWMERGLRSVANFTRSDAEGFLSLAGDIPIETVSDLYPLSDVNIALGRLKSGDVEGAAVLTV